MVKLKRKLLVIAIIIVTIFSMMVLTSCDSGDSDGDGLTDEFEQDIGTDPDNYDYHDDIDWDQAQENYDDNN